MEIERNKKLNNSTTLNSSNNFVESNTSNNNQHERLQPNQQCLGHPPIPPLGSGSEQLFNQYPSSSSSSSASSKSTSTIVANSPKSPAPAALSSLDPIDSEDSAAEDDYLYYDPFNETIDYSDALLKETRNSQEIISQLSSHDADALQDLNQVQTGFIPKFNTKHNNIHDLKAQNQLIFDVLPSFEMYHSLHSSPEDYSQTLSSQEDFPPDYFNHTHDIPSYDVSTNCSVSTTPCPSLSLVSTNDYSDLNTYASVPVPYTGRASTSQDASIPAPPPAIAPSHDIDKNYIDTAHMLYNFDSFDLKIDINVTKHVPLLNKDSEKESMLKEFTSGDVVHGYVIVENVYDKPVEFKMFHVTLEGYTSIVDKKKKKQLIKRFLTMVDLSASWSHGHIAPSANLSFESHSKDYEGCVLGLPDDRNLAPKTKYKKFFTFKLPYSLLDSACHHQQEIHTLLPPSFGVDRIKKRGKYSYMQVNPSLHYGSSASNGSPILTNDLSGEDLSVNYSINARMIGYTPSNQTRICILKDQDYSLRFIPFGFVTPISSSKKNLDSLCSNIERVFEVAERVLKLKNKEHEDVENLDIDVKSRQLSSVDTFNSDLHSCFSKGISKFPIKNKSVNDPFILIESQLNYVHKVGIFSKSKFFNKLKSSKPASLDSNNFTKSGLLFVSTKISKDGLPYRSPGMIAKANEISNLSMTGFENYDSLSRRLSSTEKQELSSLKFTLNFLPSDHSSDLSPPEIKTIKTALSAFNVYSSSSIPVKLSYDLINKGEFDRLTYDKFNNYFTQFNELKSKFESRSNDSILNDYIDDSIFQDIKAMKDIKVEKHSIPSFFQQDPIIEQTNWEFTSSSWERALELKLSFCDEIDETIIPNFQTCLLSRFYCINIDLVLANNQHLELTIPIRVRKLDNL